MKDPSIQNKDKNISYSMYIDPMTFQEQHTKSIFGNATDSAIEPLGTNGSVSALFTSSTQ